MINVAILGLGGIAKYYLNALSNNSRFKIRALIDKKEKEIKDVVSQYSIFQTKNYFDYIDFYNDVHIMKSIDVVIICLPNYLHFDSASRGLKANKHIICEKPLSLNSDEAKKLLELSIRNKLLLMTFFHRRFNLVLQQALPIFLSKKIVAAHATYFENIQEHSGQELWYEDPTKCGGGCIIDNGSNVIDVFSLVFGHLKPKFYSYTSDIKKVERNAYIILEHSKGCATIELDWDYNGERKETTFYFNDGKKLTVDFIQTSEQDNRTKLFKGSLWHEYETGLSQFTKYYDSLILEKNLEILIAVNQQGYINQTIIDQIYQKSLGNKI